jgi:hypothetical protein
MKLDILYEVVLCCPPPHEGYPVLIVFVAPFYWCFWSLFISVRCPFLLVFVDSLLAPPNGRYPVCVVPLRPPIPRLLARINTLLHRCCLAHAGCSLNNLIRSRFQLGPISPAFGSTRARARARARAQTHTHTLTLSLSFSLSLSLTLTQSVTHSLTHSPTHLFREWKRRAESVRHRPWLHDFMGK